MDNDLTHNERLCLKAWKEGQSKKEDWGRAVISRKTGLSDSQTNHGLAGLRRKGIIPPRLPQYGSKRAVALPDAGSIVSGPDDQNAIDLPNNKIKSIFPKEISPISIGYTGEDDKDKIARLEAELSDLRKTQEWLTHSSAQEHRGGTFTLNLSDLHIFDRGFMLNVMSNLEEKTIQAMERFKPQRFIGVLNGDIIPGTGIYRNQQLENVLPRADQQVAAGAYRFLEFDRLIANNFDGPREWIVIEGNHDRSHGEPIIMKFVMAIRQFDVPARFAGTECVVNVADGGFYNILFEHGYGNSAFGPTSNKMILETYRKVIGYYGRGYYGEKRIHRVAAGHTHYLCVAMERAEGLEFDTTGGLHRNDRANIGKNTRPVGWIAYVSPPGSDEILSPIPLRPSSSVLRIDLDDPELENKNRSEAARCLTAFADEARKRGIISDDCAL